MTDWQWKIDWKGVLAGGIVIIFGLAVAMTSIDYGIGTARRMDTGYYPMLLGFAAVLIGAGIVIFEGIARVAVSTPQKESDSDNRSVSEHDGSSKFRLSGSQLRTIILVPLSIAIFALMLEPVGLVPATILLILTSGVAAPQPKLLRLVLIAVLTPVGLWLAFVEGLGLPFKLF